MALHKPGGETKPIRVLHLITELDAGGAQSALLRYLQNSNRQRFAPTVVCLYNGDRVVADQIRSLGINVYDLEMRTKFRAFAVWRFVTILRNEKPTILHAWMFHANVFGRLLGWIGQVPIVITSRRNVEIGGQMREQIKRWTGSLDHAVIAVCELARQKEISESRLPEEKVVTIHNGLELSPVPLVEKAAQRERARNQLEISSGTLALGIVGRLHRQKGHLHLLEAMALLREKFPHVHLFIIGDGDERGAIEEKIQQLHLGNQVTMLGLRDDVPALLPALDLFLLSSLWEGLPNVLLEAMATGLPVVATDVGGTPEIVIHEETGLLVPPAEPHALAQSILALAKEPSLRSAMGKAGRERVRTHFSLQKMVTATENLYKRLL